MVKSTNKVFPTFGHKLRDVCRCSSCFNPVVQSRVSDFTDIDPEVYALQLKTNEQLHDHVGLNGATVTKATTA